jgi:hypothetical protein
MPTGASLSDEEAAVFVNCLNCYRALASLDAAQSSALMGSLSFGLGAYESAADLLANQDAGLLEPLLKGSLAASLETTRYWACLIASRRPLEPLRPGLVALLRDQSSGVRTAAVTALAALGESSVEALREALPNETDSDVQELIVEVLEDLGWSAE